VLRDQSPLGRPQDRFVSSFQYYVNGDYRFRAYLIRRDVWGDLDAKVSFTLNRVDNTVFYQPDVNTLYFYAANSETYSLQFEHPLLLAFQARAAAHLRVNRHHDAPPSLFGANTLTSDFFRDPETGVLDPQGRYRGLNQDFNDRILQLTLLRDTRNNENIPVAGSWFDLSGYWHDADKNHDFYEWKGRYTKFFKLGRERYEISPAEERKRAGVNLNQFIRELELQRLRQQIFSRKVVVAHVYAAQSYELPGNSMPVYGLQTLGNDTPLRGYPGPRFRNYAVAATSLEYRFPILRIMDGSLFNEYGLYGRSLDDLEIENLKNSWGFGIRVRRPDMFLFRVEVGFHGFSGMTLNATADAPF
jgi:outer membrane protein assembly factor BamA